MSGTADRGNINFCPQLVADQLRVKIIILSNLNSSLFEYFGLLVLSGLECGAVLFYGSTTVVMYLFLLGFPSIVWTP